MGADVVIRAEGLGKKYIIGHQGEREQYIALRDVIARNARNLVRTGMDLVKGRPNIVGDHVEEFWALRDVGFEVGRGEVVGVIGRNGAGKSTLLKILSRITEPTEGRVEIRGRVASLLEVGTGFHPELTGRENIFLNGAVLGMSRGEIRRKFDDIVAFAEVERFLDTPVKRYSSGMYVRLAFAVAAHLEPEILIIDEVLSVGDAEFQKKCLGKMGEVAGEGRTVLFVSHNMASVASLCRTGIMLAGGQIVRQGQMADVIAAYIESSARVGREVGPTMVQSDLFLDHIEVTPPYPETGAAARLTFSFTATQRGTLFDCEVLICAPRGDRVAVIDTKDSGGVPFSFERGAFNIEVDIAGLPLVDGGYTFGLSVQTDSGWQQTLEIAELEILPGRSRRPSPIPREWRGQVALEVTSSVSLVPCVSGA